MFTKKIGLGLGLVWGLATACGAAGVEQVESSPGALVRCPGGLEDEHYDFAQMSGNLAQDPSLAAFVGLSGVASCEDARTYIARIQQFDELVAELDDPGIQPVTPPPIDTAIQGIMNADGTNQSQAGVVEIGGGCNGIVINERAILTAAHCVDQLVAPNKNGWANLNIRRYTPAEVAVYSGQVRINVHPDYSGDGDTGDDVAVIKLFAPDTFDLGDEHRTRIYTGGGDTVGTMRLYGRGPSDEDGNGSSVLRFMYFAPDWWGPEHFLQHAGESRTCRGDSGGPTIDWTPNTGFRVVVGLHSNSEKSIFSGECAMWNGKMRSVRLQNKIAWIEDMIDFDCHDAADGAWSYVRCW
ncbi:S1 family peptidase [Myxococcota bacterium]|nr:S1 family peptidase [Myxococcota bacterium]